MAGPPGARDCYQEILEKRREILEDNIPWELSSLLIREGILEPSEQDKLKQIRKSNGLRECQKAFSGMLIERSWTCEEWKSLRDCLEELNETFLITKIYKEKVEATSYPNETGDANANASKDGVGPCQGTGSITVIGNSNQVISDSIVNITHR